ncbi:CDC42 small effector protein 1 isoform X1 [Strix aluco]|uniref:CDC42 small effector protein 1 isoform X1 n=1 Tax=Strix aluco TaxID=111821 RepID=UPI003DA69DF2
MGTTGPPLPLGALTPRGRAAGAARARGRPWGQRGHPGARSCPRVPARPRMGTAPRRRDPVGSEHPWAPQAGVCTPFLGGAGPSTQQPRATLLPAAGRKRRPAAVDFGPIRRRRRRGRGRDFSCLPARWGLAPVCRRGRAPAKLGLASAQPPAAPHAGVATLQRLIQGCAQARPSVGGRLLLSTPCHPDQVPPAVPME